MLSSRIQQPQETYDQTTEGVRIKTRLNYIFIYECFSLDNLIMHLFDMLRFLRNDWLRQIYVI